MVMALNISRMDRNKKETGGIINTMAMVWRINLMVVNMTDNMKMTLGVARVLNISRVDRNNRGTGRMIKGMAMA